MLHKQAKYPCYISEQVHIRSNGDSSSSNSSTENRALFDAHAMYKRQVTTLLCCVLVHHGPHCLGLRLKINCSMPAAVSASAARESCYF